MPTIVRTISHTQHGLIGPPGATGPAGPQGPKGDPGTGGGGGTSLPASSNDGQVLAAKVAATGGVVWVNEPYLSWLDPRVGGLDGDSGVNQTAAVNNAVALLANGGKLQLPQGRILLGSQPNPFPNTTTIVGASSDRGIAASVQGTIAFDRGTVIQPFGGFTGTLLRFGVDPGTKVPPIGGRIQHLTIDGKNQCNPAIVDGWRWVLDGATFARPGSSTPEALVANGNGLIVLGGCSFSGNGVGTGISLHGNDFHIYDSTVQHFQRGFLQNFDQGGLYATGNHIFQGTVATASVDFLLTGTGVVLLASNVIENTIGPQVTIAPAAGVAMNDVEILSNMFYWGNATTGTNPQPADTYANIKVDLTASGSSLFGLAIQNNSFHNKTRNTGLVQTSGSPASVAMFSMHANKGKRHQHIFTAGSTIFPDAGCSGNTIYTAGAFAGGATILRDTNQGIATFSGDSATVDFPIPHGLDGTPVIYDAHAISHDGRVALLDSVTVDATNVTAHFANTPVTGTNNVAITWRAALYGQ